MTISSSLNAGVAGLNANATRLATISDNIANSSTYGYKRAEADFQSMVITDNGSGSYSAGGVRATTTRVIDERGPLVATSNSTDLAVAGSGMLPVTTMAAVENPNGNYPLNLMTTGSFSPNEDGYLTTATGMVLMGWPADPDGTVPDFPRDTVAGLEPIEVTYNQFAGDPTTLMDLNINLPADATKADSGAEPIIMPMEYFGNLGTSETLTATYTPTIPASGASNTWTLSITDSASDGAVIAEFELVFNTGRDTGGSLASVTALSGGSYNDTEGTLDLTVAGGPISLEIGGLGGSGVPTKMTQLSDTYSSDYDKNGTPVGGLTGVRVDENGMVNAIYDNGATRTIYQIPLVDVPNPNGLMSKDNQAYSVSSDSGAFFLYDAGDGPTGDIVGFALEESTADVAGELTRLITTQRAYSSNAKIIQTVDEMLQETTNIKR
ncbi:MULTISPECIES: flagellar hook protein FlgE [unclassified Dinoroseobacter]|uniref:flagellar hook protein FlgE n=1 Tax=unclassified Dinoroseobacter TaxID=2620028 RepID=UPI003C7C01E4